MLPRKTIEKVLASEPHVFIAKLDWVVNLFKHGSFTFETVHETDNVNEGRRS